VIFDQTNDSMKLYIILKLSETLSFVGTVALTVLQGSISLFGSIIPASSIRHPVYAPKNYPIATIASIEYLRQSPVNPTLPAFMEGLVSESDAILEIEDLHSGVQGLYQVCPIHLAIFEGPVETKFDFKLRQFFPVCPPHSP
jgi:polynucleotide 5'-hydroxyl-kinase GRC3/NOL9